MEKSGSSGMEFILGIGNISTAEDSKRLHLRYTHDKGSREILRRGSIILALLCFASSSLLSISSLKSCLLQLMRDKLCGR